MLPLEDKEQDSAMPALSRARSNLITNSYSIIRTYELQLVMFDPLRDMLSHVRILHFVQCVPGSHVLREFVQGQARVFVGVRICKQGLQRLHVFLLRLITQLHAAIVRIVKRFACRFRELDEFIQRKLTIAVDVHLLMECRDGVVASWHCGFMHSFLLLELKTVVVW